MSDKSVDRSEVVTTLAAAEALLGDSANSPDDRLVARIVELLRDVQLATPGGAGLHAQLDTVARWVALLVKPAEHQRFGGASQVRDHVALQFRLARAAADDYLRATP